MRISDWSSDVCSSDLGGMTKSSMRNPARNDALALAVLNSVQNPVILVEASGNVAFANWEAEAFFGVSASHLARNDISTLIPFGIPLLALLDPLRERKAPATEYRVYLSSPQLGQDTLVDPQLAHCPSEPGPDIHV